MKLILSLFWFLFLWLMEALRPLKRDHKIFSPFWSKRWGRNLGLALLASFISANLLNFADLLRQESLFLEWFSWRGQWFFADTSQMRYVMIIIDVLLLDLWLYIWHRMNHEIPFFWRFHQIHHYDQTLDVSSAIRFHFGEIFISAIFLSIIMILTDMPLLHVFIFMSLSLLAALFSHSNIIMPIFLEKLLSPIIVTPAHHWMHHHAIRCDTDSNYATIFSFWDRLFNSFTKHNRNKDMKIGLEGVGDDLPLIRLITLPFLKQR